MFMDGRNLGEEMSDKLTSVSGAQSGRPATLSKTNLTNARAHLKKVDQTMASLMTKVGKTEVRSEAELSVYHSLLRAIVYQMLSTKSAAAIYGRLVDSCSGDICPASVAAVGEQTLRNIGFSRAKVASAMDLTEKVQNGVIPGDVELRKLSDQALIDCLTDVRGIGSWTVEMLLIFNLRRVNVLPVTDLGVRKGHMLAYGLDDMLPARELLAAGEIWQPYRSLAAWYLWRATDSVDW